MNKIKQFRKKMGMTQKELSEKSGISRPYISKLENNECIIIKSSTMVAIANALQKPVSVIFFKWNVHHKIRLKVFSKALLNYNSK